MRGQAFLSFVIVMSLFVGGFAVASLSNLGQKAQSIGKEESFVQALFLADSGIQRHLLEFAPPPNNPPSVPTTYTGTLYPIITDPGNPLNVVQDTTQPLGSYSTRVTSTCGGNCACADPNDPAVNPVYACPPGATCWCYTFDSTGTARDATGTKLGEREILGVVVSQTGAGSIPPQLFVQSWKERRSSPYQ